MEILKYPGLVFTREGGSIKIDAQNGCVGTLDTKTRVGSVATEGFSSQCARCSPIDHFVRFVYEFGEVPLYIRSAVAARDTTIDVDFAGLNSLFERVLNENHLYFRRMLPEQSEAALKQKIEDLEQKKKLLEHQLRLLQQLNTHSFVWSNQIQ
jgi:hypothetical protein